MKKTSSKKFFCWKNLLIALSVFFFFVCVTEGTIYYRDVSDSLFIRIMLNIQNAIQAFFMSSQIGMMDVAKGLAQGSALRNIIAYLYIATVVLAPLCTATAIISFAKTLWYRLHTSLKILHRKQHILLGGYNAGTEQLISSIQKETKLPVILFTREEITPEQRLALQKKSVRIVDFSDSQEAQALCRQNKIERAACIILLHKDSADNFSSFLELDSYIRSCSRQARGSIPCYLFSDSSIREILDEYYDCREAEDQSQTLHLDLHVLDPKALQAREIFQKVPLYTWNLASGQCQAEKYCDYEETADNPWNVHLLVAGFGNLGQSVLSEALQQSVLHPQSRILIDVVDHRMREQFQRFCKRFSPCMKDITEKSSGGELEALYRIRLDHKSTPGGGSLDGLLELRFYNTDVCHETFEEIAERVSQESPLTYAVICIKDTSLSLAAAGSLEKILQNAGNGSAPLVLAANREERILEYLQDNDTRYRNISVIAGDSTFLTLERITSAEEERCAKEFNYKYNLLSQVPPPETEATGSAPDAEEIDRQWRKMPIFKRNSSRAMGACANIRRLLLAHTPGLTLPEAQKALQIESDAEDVQYINSHRHLKAFSMLEHRRWCYFMIANGYAWTDGPKDDARKVNPCILSWENLCRKKPEYCRYDIAAFLPELSEGE